MAEPITSAAAKPVAQDSTEALRVTEERDAQGRKIYRIHQEFVIEGRVQKPTAFILLNRQSINYQWTQLKQGFADRITESVKHPPF